MRPTFLIFGFVSFLAGCSNYVTEKVLPTGCSEETYYLDADQDGWGSTTGEALCQPKDQHTARNRLDCNDSSNQVTGKIGSVCPQNAIKGDNEYAAKVFGTREYAAIIGSTLSGSEAAAGSCGEYGWGGRWGNDNPGGLATFPSMQGLFRVINEIELRLGPDDLNQSHYAAWVGVVEEGGVWVFERNNSSVTDGTASEFQPSVMGFCGGDTPLMTDITTEPKRLALVRTHDTGDWCFGKPSDANPKSGDGGLIYSDLAANFICERPRPDVRCHVAENDSPWLEPCSCRVARGESEGSLKGYFDPASLIDADTELYFSRYESQLCLDPDKTQDPA